MGRRPEDMVELRLFLTQRFIDVDARPRWHEALWVRLVGTGLLVAVALFCHYRLG